MALHPAAGLFALLACAPFFGGSHAMQGSLAAAAARTANSDGPLPFFVSTLFPPAHTHPTSPYSSVHLRLPGLAPVRYCPVLQVYSSRLCVPHHPSPTRSPTHPRPRPPAHRRLPASCPACLAAGCCCCCCCCCCWPRRRRLRPPPADRHFQSFPLSRMRVGVRGCRATTHKCSAQPAPPS
jgi:hypothetical protein